MPSSAKRISLVTGANKGISFKVTRQLGKAGHRVLLGARDVASGEAAAATLKAEGIDVHFIHIDLVKPTSIQAAAATIHVDYGRLDVLVNNAGIADRADGPPNSHRGTQTIPEGAAEAIRLALLPDDGPTGTYSDRKGIVPW